MLSRKKEQLRREIERRERELQKLDELPDLEALTEGTVLALFVTHNRSDPYTYITYLTGSRFYLTGASSPNKVSADELAEWLTTSGRRLVGAAVVGQVSHAISELAFDLGEAMLGSMTEQADRRTYEPNPYGD